MTISMTTRIANLLGQIHVLKTQNLALKRHQQDKPSSSTHAVFMQAALAQAELAVQEGNHPFGAVLVFDGKIVLAARNSVHTDNNAMCHAESNLCSLACTSGSLSEQERERCVLYTSTEPCPMCCGAIYWTHIGKVVYGCPAKDLGTISGEELGIGCREFLSSGTLHEVEVEGPVMAEEAVNMHKHFWPSYNGPK